MPFYRLLRHGGRSEGSALGGVRRALPIAILLLAFAVRLYFALTSAAVPDYTDMLRYEEAAGGTGVPTTVPPAYPLFLRAIYAVFGAGNYRAVYAVQALISSLTVLLIYRIARAVASARVALIAAGVAAVYPNLAAYTGVVMTETPALLVVTALVALLVSRQGERRKAIGATILLAIAFLLRPVLLFLVPGVFLSVRKRALFAIASILVLAPLVVWEIRAGGSLERGAAGMYKTYHEPTRGKQLLFDPRAGVEGEGTEVARENIDRSLDAIRKNPDHMIETIYGKTLVLVSAGWDQYVLAPVVGSSRTVDHIMRYAYLPIMMLGAIGMARFLSGRTRALALPALSYILLTILLSIFKVRYRLPLEPFLIIYGSMLVGRYPAASAGGEDNA